MSMYGKKQYCKVISLQLNKLIKTHKKKNTGVGCHFLFHRIFPTQGLNPGLPHCRQILYYLSHQGSPETYIAICKIARRTLSSVICDDLEGWDGGLCLEGSRERGYMYMYGWLGFPRWLSDEESAFNAEDTGDTGLISGLWRFPGGGHGNPLQ